MSQNASIYLILRHLAVHPTLVYIDLLRQGEMEGETSVWGGHVRDKCARCSATIFVLFLHRVKKWSRRPVSKHQWYRDPQIEENRNAWWHCVVPCYTHSQENQHGDVQIWYLKQQHTQSKLHETSTNANKSKSEKITI